MKKNYLLLLMCIGFSVISYAFDTYTKTLQVGESFTISPYRPYKRYFYADYYKISNSSVAWVTVVNRGQAGYITEAYPYGGGSHISGKPFTYEFIVEGLEPGETIIDIGYLDNGEWANNFGVFETDMRYKVKVVGIKNISIPPSVSLKIGEQYTFSPIITDAEATTTLTWQSCNETAASINSEGVLTAKAVGSTEIICTAQNGVFAKCVVMVNPVPATGMSLNYSSYDLQPDGTVKLETIVAPENATDKSVTWSSSNPNVARVSSNGLVTAVKSGTCHIVATTTDGSNLSAECLIHVHADSGDEGNQESMIIWRNGLYESFNINEVDSVSFNTSATTLVSDISLSQGTLRMKVGETKRLTATVYPGNAGTRAVAWESDNRYVATVDQSGLVTAKSIGSCVITAQAKDGSGVKATCLLTVEVPDIIDDNIKYISTAQELADFANMVNAGAYNINAILTNDINFTAYPDVMIGSEDFAYRGDFDGAGHTIALDLHRSSDRAALFYMLEGRVHDLTTVGTITTSAKFAAGIAALTSNATIERCQSLVTIESSIEGDGTHGGIVGVSRDGTIISDCLISGSINGSQTNRCGGVSGWAEGKTDISNCLIRSTFAVDTFDSDLLARNSQNVTSSNNYFHGNWNAPNDCGNVTLLTDMQEKSGEACILLNAGRTGNETAWYQTLGMDNYPVPDKTHKIVVYDGTNGYHNSILAMRQRHPKSIYLPFAIDYNAIIGDFELVDTGEHSISFHK